MSFREVFLILAFVLNLIQGYVTEDGPFTDSNAHVVSLFVLYRHGDRGPVSSFPNDPYFKPEYWPQGYGQLTMRGMQRQYELGQWLRTRYSEFIPEFYSPLDIYIYSTDLDRALMSASANLAGLYPPDTSQMWNKYLKWQPIPVHTNKLNHIFPDRDDCHKYKQEYKDVKKLKHFKELNDKYKNLYNDLTKKTGNTIDDLKGVRHVRDVIYVYENYNQSYVPSWASKFDRKTLNEITGLHFQRHSYTENLKKYLTGPFFHTLTNHFEAALNSSQHRKIFMVSVNEISLVSVLDAIGAYDFFPPDFAASIFFELRKSESNYYVQVYYKKFDGLKELQLHECSSSCSYTSFKTIVSKFSMDLPTWKIACGKKTTSDVNILRVK